MFPKDNNPYWPLVADYGELTREGQRQARLAVCRDTSSFEAYWAGHLFFRHHYLEPQGESFYGEGGLQPSSEIHVKMMECYYRFPLSVCATGRGYGKSTLFDKEVGLRETVCFPYRQVVIGMASDKLVARIAEPMMIQYETNARIIDDFGKLVPRKGLRRIFNRNYMGLLNGAVLEMLTTGSRQRGTRTSIYILDDPEYDPDSKTQERYQDLRDKLENLIERRILYMLRPGHVKFFWIGTMLGAHSYLYHVCFSKDPKYKAWARRVLSGAVLDSDGKIQSSAWSARFSVDHLNFVRSVSEDAFMTEIINCPAEKKARLLRIATRPNLYTVDKLPANLAEHNSPHLPDPEAVMTYHYFIGYDDAGRRRWQVDRVNQKAHFDAMYRIALFDYAENNTSKSDLKALSIVGVDARNTKWVMDLWAGRMPDNLFWDFMIRFCAVWRVQMICPESIARQKFLVETISRRTYEQQSESLIPLDFNPAIVPVVYPQGRDNIAKAMRIKETFEYQLPKGSWKFPDSYRLRWPFNEMFKQFEFFTMDLAELKRDDIIDSLAMENYVDHGKGQAQPTKGIDPVADIKTMIRQGKSLVPGEEALVGMPIDHIREDYLCLLAQQQEAREKFEKENYDNVWEEPAVVG